MIRVIG